MTGEDDREPRELMDPSRIAGLAALGEVVIFNRRDAKTLERLAAFFDTAHSETNIKTLEEIVALWQAMSTLGAAGRFVLWIAFSMLGTIGLFATITGRWPWIVDLFHGNPPVPPK